jgi:hypothetical protein
VLRRSRTLTPEEFDQLIQAIRQRRMDVLRGCGQGQASSSWRKSGLMSRRSTSRHGLTADDHLATYKLSRPAPAGCGAKPRLSRSNLWMGSSRPGVQRRPGVTVGFRDSRRRRGQGPPLHRFPRPRAGLDPDRRRAPSPQSVRASASVAYPRRESGSPDWLPSQSHALRVASGKSTGAVASRAGVRRRVPRSVSDRTLGCSVGCSGSQLGKTGI